MFVKDLQWNRRDFVGGEDTMFTAYSDIGRLTVLDRLTGCGDNMRDIETGYMDNEKHFWLASGHFDIRDYPDLTIQEAVDKIKNYANTCNGD